MAAGSDLASWLAAELGGRVSELRRLTGGASRVTSSFDLTTAEGETQGLILQQYRSGGLSSPEQVHCEVALLRAAHDAGVPTPRVVATGVNDETSSSWLVVERLTGETIPRKILRDAEWALARTRLSEQCAQALADIHRIDASTIPGLAARDPFERPLTFLDAIGVVRPALEYAVQWLERNRPESLHKVVVHGDFRMGNLLVNADGLGGVLDWELAHQGDPAEDIGWLSARSWRFGGEGAVAGLGSIDELLAAYRAAGGSAISADRVRWWQIYAAVKWAVICALQAASHLSGTTKSLELAAIGRRVCESEWDVFVLLGIEPEPLAGPAISAAEPFGSPSAAELLDATAHYLEDKVMTAAGGGAFEARIARNVVRIVERQITLGPRLIAAHRDRLEGLGFSSDEELAGAIRRGLSSDVVATAVCSATRDQLLVANPSYLGRLDR